MRNAYLYTFYVPPATSVASWVKSGVSNSQPVKALIAAHNTLSEILKI